MDKLGEIKQQTENMSLRVWELRNYLSGHWSVWRVSRSIPLDESGRGDQMEGVVVV